MEQDIMRRLVRLSVALLLVAILLLPLSIIANSHLYEYYNTNDDDEHIMHSINWRMQTFTTVEEHNVTSVKMKFLRAGYPGNMTVGIKAVDGDSKPTGGDLCNGTLNCNNVSDSVPGAWYEITMNVGYNLAASTQYAIVARAPEGNLYNFIYWRVDWSSPTYDGGNIGLSYTNGTNWTLLAGQDFMFEIWGEGVATPLITTNNATYIKRTSARLNSYLTYDGSEPCDIRFQYGNSTGNYTVNTTWVNDTYTTGNSPYVNITNLTNSTVYFFRVQANNNLGMTNGSELNFTTSTDALPPTNFTAYPDSTTISLTWIKGTGSTYTMIRQQTGAYPANYTDGKQVYNGSMSTALDTNLTRGTSYYYRAWGFDDIGYSENYTDVLMTTSAYTTVTNDTPTTPTQPSNWWGTPDYTNLENIAGYAYINEIADEYGIPYNTFWMSLILVIIMCIGLFIYSVQHNVTVALMLIGVMIIVASVAGLLPLWLIAAIGIPIAGIMLVKRRI